MKELRQQWKAGLQFDSAVNCLVCKMPENCGKNAHHYSPVQKWCLQIAGLELLETQIYSIHNYIKQRKSNNLSQLRIWNHRIFDVYTYYKILQITDLSALMQIWLNKLSTEVCTWMKALCELCVSEKMASRFILQIWFSIHITLLLQITVSYLWYKTFMWLLRSTGWHVTPEMIQSIFSQTTVLQS